MIFAPMGSTGGNNSVPSIGIGAGAGPNPATVTDTHLLGSRFQRIGPVPPFGRVHWKLWLATWHSPIPTFIVQFQIGFWYAKRHIESFTFRRRRPVPPAGSANSGGFSPQSQIFGTSCAAPSLGSTHMSGCRLQ